MKASERKRLRDLVSAMCDRNLSEQEFQELDELLLSNDLAIDEAVRLLEINAELHEHAALAAAMQAGKDSDSERDRAVIGISTAPSGRKSRWQDSAKFSLLAFAATLLVVLASIVTWNRGGDRDRQANAPAKLGDESVVAIEAAERDAAQNIAARIVRKIDCNWQDDSWGVQNAADIRADQTLTMRRGLMELEFTSGARVTIQGPASLTVVSPMSAVLLHGRLTAHVPKQAQGFTVQTPEGQAIDLGTRFGLAVDDQGETEAHVFEGEVIVRDTAAQEDGAEEIHLTDDMALKFGDENSPRVAGVAEPQRFMQLDFASEPAAELPVITDDLALWLSAEHHVQKDAANKVSGWGDATGRSESTIGAWQVRSRARPLFLKGVFEGKPGIHFNGSSYLVTDPMRMEADCSACIVFRFNAGLIAKRRVPWPQGLQILNCNGPSTMVVRLSKKLHVSGHMYAGLKVQADGKEKHTNTGITRSPALAEKTAHVVVFVNDTSSQTTKLYVDGELVAEQPCNVGKTTEVPRFIGTHNTWNLPRFVGSLGELLIYNQALSKDDALELSQSLMDKYGVSKE